MIGRHTIRNRAVFIPDSVLSLFLLRMRLTDLKNKILSFYDEVIIEQRKSCYDDTLEVVWVNGRKVLNCAQANYSYGTLLKIFRKTLKQIRFEKEEITTLLILGYGAGGTGQLIREAYDYKGIIHGVELDQQVVELTKKHFPKGYAAADELFICDALAFVERQDAPAYDMIIFDVYVDLFIPEHFHQEAFIRKMHDILNPNGLLLFNKVIATKPDIKKVERLQAILENQFASTQILSKGLEANRMFVCRKGSL